MNPIRGERKSVAGRNTEAEDLLEAVQPQGDAPVGRWNQQRANAVHGWC